MAGRKAKSYRKNATVGVRLTDDEAALVARAAELETARRGELVQGGPLLRELAIPRVREIVEAAA